jgi:hypothetical protein
VQATFAQLQQTHPLVSPLYRGQRLWEANVAAGCAMDLRDALTGALQQQRAQAIKRIARRGIIAPLVRWLLTIGAVLWFPIVQPVLEVMLKDHFVQTVRDGLILAVQLLGAAYLLRSAGFLAIWFLFLWLVLRWDTHRRVARLLGRWRGLDSRDATVNPSAAVLAWADELLDPIRSARDREESLVRRAEEIRQTLNQPAAA